LCLRFASGDGRLNVIASLRVYFAAHAQQHAQENNLRAPAPGRTEERTGDFMTDFPNRTLMVAALALALAACQQSESPAEVSSAQPAPATTADQAVVAEALAPAPVESPLAAVLAAQPEEVQARYAHRHPAETLTFFGIEPGMTVIEALPGGGWYSKILAPYLGTEGTLVGADYNPAMFPLFGFYSEEQLKAKETWPDDWRAQAMGWFDAPVADIDAFQFGGLPERVTGEADAVLFIPVF
jgi:hypothetical protein